MANEIPPQHSTSDNATYPMVAFEHYMWADDRPSHSMAVQMRFWFTGFFNKDYFESALKQVLARHPIFQMTLRGHPHQRTKHIHWVRSKHIVMPHIDWDDWEKPLKHRNRPFHQDLTREIGLRIWVRDNSKQRSSDGEPKTLILVQFHHSVCDGVGMLHFIEDLMIHYGKVAGIPTPAPRPINEHLFSKRGDFALTPDQWRSRRWRDFKRAFNFFSTIAQPLAAPIQQQGSTTKIADLFASERRVLNRDVLKKVRHAARTTNASVNDILLHELFKTLSPWNYRFGKVMNKIRIGMATSLRTEAEATLSSVNVVSMVFLDKSHREVAGSGLLSSIVKETSDVKINRMGITLPRVMRLLGRLPFAIKIFMSAPICSATAVLTNLGATLSNSKLLGPDGKLKIGDIILESYELMPPVRPKTSVSVATNYYGGELSVTLRYDSMILTSETARELLSQYCQRLENAQL